MPPPRSSPPGPSRARVLVLTAGYGEGHNAAARALAAALEEGGGQGTAAVVDLFARANPRANAVVRAAYLAAINRAPRLWGRLYRWLDRCDAIPRRVGLLRSLNRGIEELVAAERPAAVCSTYPLYGPLLDRLAASGGFRAPHFMVVTDSLSIHSLWWRASCAAWFVPNEESAEVLREAGLDPGRVRADGFPVPLFFDDQAGRLAPPDLAAGAAPRVLHIVHSGVRRAEETARRLLAEPGWEVTCAVGRDERLRRRLAEFSSERRGRTEILGWTDQMPRLLMTHHAVVAKAGGATTQEAIAARCPMIVSQVVPGQEEGNYELLRRHGVGALAETPEAALAALRRAFSDGGGVWRGWRAALEPLARPGAARAIAARVLAEAGISHAQSAR